MYEKQKSEAELSEMGLTLEDFAEEQPVIWPENVDAYLVFMNMSTQWNITVNGPAGLNYQSLDTVIRMLKIEADDYLFSDIRVMEMAALQEMKKEG